MLYPFCKTQNSWENKISPKQTALKNNVLYNLKFSKFYLFAAETSSI